MIPVMNVMKQYESMKEELDAAALDVLHSGQYILGKTVESFERHFAHYCGTKYAVGVGNGTDALVIALKACGIKTGDEVITTAMSFFATVEAIVAVGAKPVFVDCTDDTYLLDILKIEEKITKKTKAVIPVHLYGQCVDMDPLLDIAQKYNLKIIEDAAQAAGALYKKRRAGSIGDVGCISFFPTKNLGGAGDGGMIITNDESIYKKCMAIRVHGSGINGMYAYSMMQGKNIHETAYEFDNSLAKYYNFITGCNSRLDALQAGILDTKLPYLDEWNARRREIAEKYNQCIVNPAVIKPYIAEYNEAIYYVYVLVTKKRKGLKMYMEKCGIASGIYFPIPLHLQKALESLNYKKGDMPNAEMLAECNIVIPMFPELTSEEINRVIDAVNCWNPDE